MAASKNVVELDSGNFDREVLESPVPVLVDFWAGWCAPCRMVAPAVDQVADEFAGLARVGKVDVDRHPDLAQRFGVSSIPTLAVFRGGAIVDAVIGVTSREALAEALRKHLPGA